MTTSEEFEKVFAARKADYVTARREIAEKQRELSIQLETLAKEYHGGNIELDKIRCEPSSRRATDCSTTLAVSSTTIPARTSTPRRR